MSAWQLGWDAGKRDGATIASDPSKELQTIVGKVIAWVPADIMVIFASAIAAYETQSKSAPFLLIAISVVFAPVVVLVAAYSARDVAQPPWLTKKVQFRTIAAIPAFLLWSYTIPGNPWDRIDWVDDNDTLCLILAAFAGLVFAFWAQGFEKDL